MAKTAHKKASTPKESATTKAPTMISAGHRISQNITGRTDCGILVGDAEGTKEGWHFGDESDVTCGRCNADGR